MTADTAEREAFEKWAKPEFMTLERHGESYRHSPAAFAWAAWEARAALPARAPEGWVLVPELAVKWLFGEGPDDQGFWFGDAEAPRAKGAFWWRHDLRRMLSAAPTGAEREKAKAVLLYRLAKIIAPDLEGWISPEDTPATWEAALEIAAKIAGTSAAAPHPEQKEEKPPSSLDDPSAWWAETGTSGRGDGCNKPFWLRHEAIEYVRQHGGHVAPLFRRYSTEPLASPAPGPAEPVMRALDARDMRRCIVTQERTPVSPELEDLLRKPDTRPPKEAAEADTRKVFERYGKELQAIIAEAVAGDIAAAREAARLEGLEEAARHLETVRAPREPYGHAKAAVMLDAAAIRELIEVKR